MTSSALKLPYVDFGICMLGTRAGGIDFRIWPGFALDLNWVNFDNAYILIIIRISGLYVVQKQCKKVLMPFLIHAVITVTAIFTTV